MSLKKKIALSFLISAFLIAILAVFEYVNFHVIKQEIRFLELTDTVRSKSLQLRRHEKNYFLYSPAKAEEESGIIHRYLDELDALLAAPDPFDKEGEFRELRALIREYRTGFDAIDIMLKGLTGELRRLKRSHGEHGEFFPLIEAAFYERPFQAAEFLETLFKLPPSHRLVAGLGRLDAGIKDLRKSGEGIISVSKELDRQARENVERGISASQAAIVIIFPIFLVTGVVMLFLITRNIVSRLGLLMDVMDKTGQGTIEHVKAPVKEWGNDEVGLLIRKFDDMEDELEERQALIEQKNNELHQSRKLAAIGTLAAGVAHELNNPLNNIYLSTQVLAREAGSSCSPDMKDVMGDILGQTVRVKKIVADLLEFARGREPHLQSVDMNDLVRSVQARMRSSMERVAFSLDPAPGGPTLSADPDQMEQVFVNLFHNAVDAMEGRVELRVSVRVEDGTVRTTIVDTGRGMPREALDKVFEPFYTTRDKGTGLGLAIVFKIIKKHQGEITVASEEGKGTVFTITLPKGKEQVASSR